LRVLLVLTVVWSQSRVPMAMPHGGFMGEMQYRTGTAGRCVPGGDIAFA
jgi:hypothetical protein